MSFFQHHARAISSAAALGHGRVLLKVAADARSRAVRARANALDHMLKDARARSVIAPSPALAPAPAPVLSA